jgi:hypothetical protein
MTMLAYAIIALTAALADVIAQAARFGKGR